MHHLRSVTVTGVGDELREILCAGSTCQHPKQTLRSEMQGMRTKIARNGYPAEMQGMRTKFARNGFYYYSTER
jgi:hypothetical protein